MPLNRWPTIRSRQAGSSLIEVLVAVLILSFGMLALGGMMSYAVQMPKVAGYRASASSIASGLVDRMRANTAGFAQSAYTTPSTSYKLGTLPADPTCVYPNCSVTDIATLDKNEIVRALRKELPGGNIAGIKLECTGGCGALEGVLYVIWDEPSLFSGLTLNNSNTEQCPTNITAAGDAPPRCVKVIFKL